MSQKRLRIFAGPNGSGKSSLLDRIVSAVPIGYYINADKIEKLLTTGHNISLIDFGVKANNKQLYKFFNSSSFVSKKSDQNALISNFSISESTLFFNPSTDLPPKYSTAIIAEFLRERNLAVGNDFSFETVMSHKDKLSFIKKANK